MNVEEIVQGDLNDIEECDAVLANIIKPSAGTAMEVMHAFRKGKLVVVVGERLSPWLIYHSTHQFSNIVDAITYLRNT